MLRGKEKKIVRGFILTANIERVLRHVRRGKREVLTGRPGDLVKERLGRLVMPQVGGRAGKETENVIFTLRVSLRKRKV